jgi:hypothetical protein
MAKAPWASYLLEEVTGAPDRKECTGGASFIGFTQGIGLRRRGRAFLEVGLCQTC